MLMTSYSGKFFWDSEVQLEIREYTSPPSPLIGLSEEIWGKYEEIRENMMKNVESMKNYEALEIRRAKNRAKRGASRHIYFPPEVWVLTYNTEILIHGRIQNTEFKDICTSRRQIKESLEYKKHRI